MDREVLITIVVGTLIAIMFTYTMYVVFASDKKS
jgi:hypothetical protein